MKTKLIIVLFLISIFLISCKKEEGPAGPQGPQGPAGTNGNANIKMYGYGPCTFNAANFYTQKYTPDGLTAGLIDSSIIYAYYSGGFDQWNVVNGYGPLDTYTTVLFTDPEPYIGIYLRNPDGSWYNGIDVTWDSVRIVIIPANIFLSAMNEKIDFGNYTEVTEYFISK
ncbi:MAG: hypothetical protein PHR81_03210 [Bacteroidales bacterium]|jgi:hypothetical protein|nr:hypothetical protein [Bacteroidales bacterium]MDD4213799.1 hypothetical protein [Bacteroidales bacterium]